MKPIDLSAHLDPSELPASCSKTEQDSELREVDATPRHGWKKPPIVLQQEKFEHRCVAYLKAEGKSNEEIAQITGYSDTRVGYLVKQPWMEPFILELIASRGGKKVEEFIEDHVMPALETITGIMLDEEAARRDRISCANAILDRKYGKPNQPMSYRESKPVDQMTLEEVDANLALLRQKKQQMGN